ncbi:hypothetical protein Desde_3201 [Desulfitobacterium dehalogenans ATCC 51507]|uniref:Uncharacterized protein n=1 Tax=Desulfitobacterium dehalogenans (strain ATCC 51507 / DSM 9161 / JW/IU-DC1) TaxID=756499 RepID=I4AC07_DESDJ|nr:hypothetical protein [Desulfitobacterium dehalogenans]AFM01492.1 hypothetical protein Desde_3201 [Desulfitobacterium dehalogenans ATCC 51507]
MSDILDLSSNNNEIDFKRIYDENYDDLRIGKTREIILQEKDSLKLSLEAHPMWTDHKGKGIHAVSINVYDENNRAGFKYSLPVEDYADPEFRWKEVRGNYDEIKSCFDNWDKALEEELMELSGKGTPQAQVHVEMNDEWDLEP